MSGQTLPEPGSDQAADAPLPNLGMQGFWPDGLYTAPTDEALQYDMDVALSVNLTTLRKHIKVEPDRWYYHADRCALL